MVAMKLANKDDATISRNDNFYTNHGIINNSLFSDDMIHVKGDGISRLASNSRFALCRALGKEVVAPKRKLGHNNKGRFNR